MYSKMLGEEVNAALLEVRDRLWGFFKYPYNARRQEIVDGLIRDIHEECVADFKRNCQVEISREYPIIIGDAINLIPSAFSQAKMILVDSSTRRGIEKIPKFEVNAKAFRPFIPAKGTKSDKSYFSLIQSSLNKETKDVETVKKIIHTKFDDNGMFDSPTEELSMYAPRICLIYANINSLNRMVFMLRPNYKLNRIAYRAYCYVVICSLVKRIHGSACNMDMWSSFDSRMKMVYSQSMIVTDSMLVTRPDEITRFPLIHKTLDMKRFAITSGELFPMVA